MRVTGVVSICCLVFVMLLVFCAVGSLAGSSNGYQGIRSKPRSIRGFKNVALSTARGFGKRGNQGMDLFASSGLNDEHSDKNIESLPVDWFVQEVQSNPELARILVSKFLDTNQDGLLTADELLRPTY